MTTPDARPMAATPLLTVRFEQMPPEPGPVVVLIRQWYHAPRVGDEISIGDVEGDGPMIDGGVELLSWRDRTEQGDPDVVVMVR